MLKLKNLLSMFLVLAFGGVASAQALSLEFNKNSLRKEKDESAHVIDLTGAPGTEGADWNKLRAVDVRLKSLGLPGTLFLFVNGEPVDSVQLKGEANELNDLSVKIPSTVRPPINDVSLRLRGWFSLVDGKIAVALRFGEGAVVPNPMEPKPVEPKPVEPKPVEPKPVQPKPEPPVVEPITPPTPPERPPVVTPKPVEPKPEPKPVVPKPVVPKPKPVVPPTVTPRPEPRPPVVTPRPPVRPPVVTPRPEPRPPVDDGRCYKGFCPGDHVVNDLGLSGTVVGIGPDPSGLRPGKCILVKWSFARDRAPACRFPGEIDKP